MNLSNKEIVRYVNTYFNAFNEEDKKTTYLPVKINFYIQKNIKTLYSLAEEVEKARLEIFQHYGKFNPEVNEFIIEDKEKQEIAIKELNDLLEISQEVDIKLLNVEDFNDLNLNMEQLDAIMFMIQEE